MERKKQCSYCKTTKDVTQFNLRSNRKDGFTSRCKLCLNMAQQEHRQKFGQQDANARYYVAHKKQEQARISEWREANKEHIAIKNREYRQNHPEAKRESEQRRRARKAGVPSEPIKLSVVLERYGSTCYLCLKITKRPTLDHIVPLALGGAHTYENIRIACGPCNSKKKDRLISAGAFA
jgi:5-methylcytosine-specific restriction endonuclease McrA